jgi:polysaccharide pyruvyl transferase WcaK-like protein
MRNPYFASRPDFVRNGSRISVDEISTKTGNNTGNLMFFSAIRRVVEHQKPSDGFSFDPGYVRENHDGIIIPAANWLTARRDMGNFAALIEKANLPTVLVGIGAQSFDGKAPELQPSTKQFLAAVAARSHSIAARGSFTAEVIEKAGVKNVEVTGCPSLLWHVTRPASVMRSVPPNMQRVVINSTRHEERDADRSASIGMRLLRYAYNKKFDFVVQTEFDLLRIARSEPYDQSLLAEQAKILGDDDQDRVLSYLKRHVLAFTDVPSWIAYNATKDFVVGMRLHGVISALLAGVPAMLIIHDTRTREMARQAGIPFTEAKELSDKSLSVSDLAKSVNFEHFNIVQRRYFSNFADFFNKNDVSHNLKAHPETN